MLSTEEQVLLALHALRSEAEHAWQRAHEGDWSYLVNVDRSYRNLIEAVQAMDRKGDRK